MTSRGCVQEILMRLFWKEEHKGENERGWSQMEEFRDCFTECGLLDLGYSGYAYTWDNNRDREDNVQVRLDRATCNDSFSSLFPLTTVENIPTESITVAKEAPKQQARGARQFCYEEMWGHY